MRQLQQKQQTHILAEKVSNLPKLAALQAELDDYKHREIMYKQRISVLEDRGTSGPREFNDAAVNSSLVEVDHQVRCVFHKNYIISSVPYQYTTLHQQYFHRMLLNFMLLFTLHGKEIQKYC